MTAARPPRKLMTIEDAADYLAMGTSTLRRWIADGKLTGYRVGDRAVRVDRAQVEALAVPITPKRSA